jgi:cyclase
MLRTRLIPVLIVRRGQVVQSLRFQHTNIIHQKAAIAVEYFNRWAADEIVVLDVTRDRSGREAFVETVSDLASRCFVPLTVGGWVTSVDDVRALLRAGADKVVVNTEAVRRPAFVGECASVFGQQCIVVAVDARRDADGGHRVWVDRGRERTEWTPAAWARRAQEAGAGEIFLTSIDHDGARVGYDLELVHSVVAAVDVPVVAFGGVSTWQHLVDGIVAGGADAVAAANVFHYTEHSAKRAKEFMRQAGLAVR